MLSNILLQITGAVPVNQDTLHHAADSAHAAVPVMGQVTEDSISLMDLILKGGIIMIPIGILSVLTIYVAIERLIAISKFSKSEKNFMLSIRDFILNGNIESAKSLCKNSNSPQAKVVEKGISRIGQPVDEIRRAMEDTGRDEVYRMEKNLNILNIVGRIAPMFGFIGTIMGVIHIFYKISKGGNGGGLSIESIADGLYEKMVTSAAGLIIGVMAFAIYHIYNIWIDRITNRIENSASQFIDLMHEPGK